MDLLVRSRGFQIAENSYVPVALPGFPGTRFQVPRPEYPLADMLTLMSGLRQPDTAGLESSQWRIKDLPAIAQMLATYELEGDILLLALANNANQMATGPVRADEFDVHGRTGQQIEGLNGLRFWDSGLKQLKNVQHHLKNYPQTEPTLEGFTAFLRELSAAGAGATFRQGAWYRANNTRVWPMLVPGLEESTQVANKKSPAPFKESSSAPDARVLMDREPGGHADGATQTAREAEAQAAPVPRYAQRMQRAAENGGLGGGRRVYAPRPERESASAGPPPDAGPARQVGPSMGLFRDTSREHR
jgi:hypothetical protein